MKCLECNGDVYETTRTHVVDLKTCIIIVRNVPCMECKNCGDAFYTDDVQQRLDEIIAVVKSMMTEIAVVEYTGSVA